MILRTTSKIAKAMSRSLADQENSSIISLNDEPGNSFHESNIIAIGGGKGGVGKSIVAANIAAGLAQAGKQVVIVDLDLGGPNLHTLFGFRKLPHGLFETK